MLIDFLLAACVGFYFKSLSIAGFLFAAGWFMSGKSLDTWPLFSSGLFKWVFSAILAAGLN